MKGLKGKGQENETVTHIGHKQLRQIDGGPLAARAVASAACMDVSIVAAARRTMRHGDPADTAAAFQHFSFGVFVDAIKVFRGNATRFFTDTATIGGDC